MSLTYQDPWGASGTLGPSTSTQTASFLSTLRRLLGAANAAPRPSPAPAAMPHQGFGGGSPTQQPMGVPSFNSGFMQPPAAPAAAAATATPQPGPPLNIVPPAAPTPPQAPAQNPALIQRFIQALASAQPNAPAAPNGGFWGNLTGSMFGGGATPPQFGQSSGSAIY